MLFMRVSSLLGVSKMGVDFRVKDLYYRIDHSIKNKESLCFDEHTPQPEIQFNKGAIFAYKEIQTYLRVKYDIKNEFLGGEKQ